MKEGRKRKNPNLAFSRRNDPTCLIFSDCLVGVLRMENVWRVSGGCLAGVLWLSGGCLEGVLGCLKGIYGMYEWYSGKSGVLKSG